MRSYPSLFDDLDEASPLVVGHAAKLTPRLAAIIGSMPTIDAANVDDVIAVLVADPSARDPRIRDLLTAVARAIARYRSSDAGAAALATAGLEIAIEDVTGRTFERGGRA